MLLPLTKEEVKSFFVKADIDQDGFVVLAELILLLSQQGVPTESIKSVMEKVDTDQDKRLSLEEFLDFLHM